MPKKIGKTANFQKVETLKIAIRLALTVREIDRNSSR
jgi:hypothetical protein